MELSPTRFSFLSQSLRRAAQRALDFFLPPLCLACDTAVSDPQALCATCWKALHMVAAPYCARCGAPFDLPVEAGPLYGLCLAEEPAFDLARSALIYDEASKNMILRLKHADRLRPVPGMAHWMIRALGPEALEKVDVIIPVPLHRWRLLKRKYNQSALLAQEMGCQTGKRVVPDLLVRIRATDSQGHKSRKERQANVAGAFAVHPGRSAAGRTILLVDDVMTSGATVSECAKVLMKAGAAAVYVTTLARTRLAT